MLTRLLDHMIIKREYGEYCLYCKFQCFHWNVALSCHPGWHHMAVQGYHSWQQLLADSCTLACLFTCAMACIQPGASPLLVCQTLHCAIGMCNRNVQIDHKQQNEHRVASRAWKLTHHKTMQVQLNRQLSNESPHILISCNTFSCTPLIAVLQNGHSGGLTPTPCPTIHPVHVKHKLWLHPTRATAQSASIHTAHVSVPCTPPETPLLLLPRLNKSKLLRT
jgi:hypothetical protein